MKTLKFTWLFALVMSMSFFACSDDNKGNSGGDDNPLSNVFTIEEAVYSPGDIPSGSEVLIEDLQVSRNAINGGSSIISFESSEALETIYVGVEGIDGYYKIDAPSNLLRSSVYYYEFVLLISQTITVDFKITISCESRTGTVSKPITSDEVEVIEVGTGKLQISLSWDQYDDVDLHLYDPEGNHVYFGNRVAGGSDDRNEFDFYCYLVEKYTTHNTSGLDYNTDADWIMLEGYIEDILGSVDIESEMEDYFASYEAGYLDLDSNAGCSLDYINNENIFYSNPPAGEYKVYVDLWSKCSSSTAGAKYSVTVNYDGRAIALENPRGQFADNEERSYDYVYIGSFTIGGNSSLRSASINKKIQNPVLERINQKYFGK